MVSLSSIDFAIVSLNRGVSAAPGNNLLRPAPASPDSIDSIDAGSALRRLEPGRMAQLYLPPFGLLAGEVAPGGSGPARRIQSDHQDIAEQGGPIISFLKLAPTFPDAAILESGERTLEWTKKGEVDAYRKDGDPGSCSPSRNQLSWLQSLNEYRRTNAYGSAVTNSRWKPAVHQQARIAYQRNGF